MFPIEQGVTVFSIEQGVTVFPIEQGFRVISIVSLSRMCGVVRGVVPHVKGCGQGEGGLFVKGSKIWGR